MRTYAENASKVNFSFKKYFSIRKQINTRFSEKLCSDMRIDFVMQSLFCGDVQPALVVSTDPLLIAAYSDEMDAVIMLRFPQDLVGKYSLEKGTRLTTSNTYSQGDRFPDDIFVGKDYCYRYVDFVPVVQLFIGKGDDQIRKKVSIFNEEIWEQVADKADKYLSEHPDLSRDGFFYFKK